jgi:hypothetical protein
MELGITRSSYRLLLVTHNESMIHMTLEEIEVELGGIQRELGTPVAVGTLYLPLAVRLERGQICWRYEKSFSTNDSKPSDRILNDFLALQNGTDRDVLNFVRHHGPLFLCEEHKLPWSRIHFLNFENCFRREVGPIIELSRSVISEAEFAEPTEPYKRLAKEAFKLLRCAVGIRKRVTLTAEEWPEALDSSLTAPLNVHDRLARHLNWWLQTAGLEPLAIASGYPAKGVRLELVTEAINPLFGVIALQLAGAISSGVGSSICECGRIYIARRLGAKYCGRCGKKAAWRKASAKYRRKLKNSRKSQQAKNSPIVRSKNGSL